MRVALYARVSTQRQAQHQTIEQPLGRLQGYVHQQGWEVSQEHIYRDEGYSGASLNRPGLDALRDRAALADLDVVVITAPDRLATDGNPDGHCQVAGVCPRCPEARDNA